MALNLDLLATLQAVVRTGSFSRAAQQLYLTQPAVSLRIMQLEQAVGSPILSRGRREGDLRLTAAGERALRLADEISVLLDRFYGEIEAAKDRHETVTIACGPAAEYLLPDVLAAFHSRFPSVLVRLPLTHGRVNSVVLAGEADMGLQAEEFVTSGLAMVPFFHGPLLLVSQSGEPIPDELSAQVSWLRTQPLVTSPLDSYVGRVIMRWASKFDLHLNVALEASTYEGIKEAVMHGFGIAILPEFAIAHELCEGRLNVAAIAGIPPETRFCFVTDETRPLSEVAQAFLDSAVGIIRAPHVSLGRLLSD